MRTAAALLVVLVGVVDGLGVHRVCTGRPLACVACRGEALVAPTARVAARMAWRGGIPRGLGACKFVSLHFTTSRVCHVQYMNMWEKGDGNVILLPR